MARGTKEKQLEQVWSRCGASVEQVWSKCGASVEQVWSKCGASVEQVWSKYGASVEQVRLVRSNIELAESKGYKVKGVKRFNGRGELLR